MYMFWSLPFINAFTKKKLETFKELNMLTLTIILLLQSSYFCLSWFVSGSSRYYTTKVKENNKHVNICNFIYIILNAIYICNLRYT